MSLTTLHVIERDGNLEAVIPNAAVVNQVGHDPEQGSKPTRVKPPRDVDFSSTRYVPWGFDNWWPTDVRQKLEASTIALSSIYKLVAMMYGKLIYYREEDSKGNPIPLKIPEVDTFLRRNNFKKYLMHQFVDYRFFMNTFPELILNKNKDKIVRLVHREAEYTRLSRQNDRSNRIEFVAYSANWPCPNSDEIKWTPLIDEHDPFGFVEKLRGHKFCWWGYFPSPGRTYYKMPYWAGLFRKNGWLDVANDIPEIISAMHKNQIVVKYHIHIPETYWKVQWPDWDTYTREKQMDIYKNKVTEMNTFLQGKDNAFKSFTTVFGVDPITKEAFPDWKIEAIDDKTKKDAYIPNSQAADAQVVQALGIDPSQLGLQPQGGKMGAGSGSDKRTSFINAVTLNSIEQDIILEPLQFIADFNGGAWEGLTFKFSHNVPGRLDENPDGTQKVL